MQDMSTVQNGSMTKSFSDVVLDQELDGSQPISDCETNGEVIICWAGFRRRRGQKNRPRVASSLTSVLQPPELSWPVPFLLLFLRCSLLAPRVWGVCVQLLSTLLLSSRISSSLHLSNASVFYVHYICFFAALWIGFSELQSSSMTAPYPAGRTRLSW